MSYWRFLSWYEPDEYVLKTEMWIKNNCTPGDEKGTYFWYNKFNQGTLYNDAHVCSKNTASKVMKTLKERSACDANTTSGTKHFEHKPLLQEVQKGKIYKWTDVEGYWRQQVNGDILNYFIEQDISVRAFRLYLYILSLNPSVKQSKDIIAKDLSEKWGHRPDSSYTLTLTAAGEELLKAGLILYNDLNKGDKGSYRKVYAVAQSLEDVERFKRKQVPQTIEILEKTLDQWVEYVEIWPDKIEEVPAEMREEVKRRIGVI